MHILWHRMGHYCKLKRNSEQRKLPKTAHAFVPPKRIDGFSHTRFLTNKNGSQVGKGISLVLSDHLS